MSMKESSMYQALLEEGRAEGRIEGAMVEARKLLRLLGDDAFGLPDARTAALIERLNNLARLEDLLQRLLTVRSWQKLIGKLPASPRGGRRRRS
jgi:hypothetical protein